MIKKIKVKNYKSFLECSVKLGPFNVLIGSNDAGKTNFLSIFKYLKNIIIGQKENLSILPYELAHCLIPGSEPNINISIEFLVANEVLTYSFSIAKHQQMGIVFIEENLYDASENGKYYLKRSFDDIIALNEVSDTTEKKTFRSNQAALPLLTDLKLNRHASMVTNMFKNILFYDFDTRKMKEFYSGNIDDQLILDERGSNLALVMRTLKNKYKEKFDNIINIVKEEIPYLENVDIVEYKNLLILLFNFKGNFSIISDMISDGLIKHLGLLALVCSPQTPYQINIEEIENHTHPHRIENAINQLRSIAYRQNSSQVILTTHSPKVLDLVQPNEVLIVERDQDKGSSVIPLIEKHDILPFIKDMTLGDAWFSRMIGGVP